MQPSRNATMKAILAADAADAAADAAALPFRLLGLACSAVAGIGRTLAWYVRRRR